MSEDRQTENFMPGITILGQHLSYPTTRESMYGLIALIIGVCVLAYIALYLAKPHNISAIASPWSSYTVDTDGKPMAQDDGKIVKFWTPSWKTRLTEGVAGWEVIDKEERVLFEFGAALAARNDVYGFRRYEVFGKGSTKAKWGWWWVATVEEDFELKQLMEIYKEYFHPNRPIYVETIEAGGTYH